MWHMFSAVTSMSPVLSIAAAEQPLDDPTFLGKIRNVSHELYVAHENMYLA